MSIQLYYRPMACSMATRIALYEAGADADFTLVQRGMRTTEAGEDYLAINPMGMVPALRIDGGEPLTENTAILQAVADRFPVAKLSPPAGSPERYRMLQWLSFISSELHMTVFHPLFDKSSNEGAKAYAYEQARIRLARLEFHLTGRDYVLDAFSIADIYLYVILNWTQATNIKLTDYPALAAFSARVRARPAAARAFAEEVVLYREELAAA